MRTSRSRKPNTPSLGATQSINPYAYAWNDPLKYVDPSGHSLLGDIIGVVVGIVVAIYLPVLLPDYFTALSVPTLAVAGFVGGFVGAYVSTGSLSASLTAGLISGVTAAAFAEVGSYASGLQQSGSEWAKPFSVVAHAAVGCGSAMLSGGNCGRGDLAAGISEAANQAGMIQSPGKSLASWGTFKGTVEAGLVGGLSAGITGGKFDDGFGVAAAGYLFNSAVHSDKNVLRGEMTIKCNGVGIDVCDQIVAQANNSNVTFADGSGVQIAYHRYNSSFWDMFSQPDIIAQVAPQFGANGEWDGGHVIFIDPSRVNTDTVGHEIGHLLGLEHNPSTDSIMYQYSVPNRSPHFDYSDVQQLVKKYGGTGGT